MNKLILLLLITFFAASCRGQKESPVLVTDLCENIVNVGDNQICLVNFDGMKEVYSDPFVKKHMDKAEPNVTEVIGVYLTPEKYKLIEIQDNWISNNKEVFVDRFKLYVAKNMINNQSTPKELEILYNGTISYFEKPEDIKDLLNNNFKDVQYGIPTFIKDYKINENAWAIVMIIKYKIPLTENETFRVSLITAMILNGKLIYSNYISEYNNEESISMAIKKNTDFTETLLEQNN